MKVRTIVKECANLGVEALTLYSFSSENWKRPPEEVAGLMELCREHLRKERQLMLEHDVRFRRIGRREGLPDFVLEELDGSEEATAGARGMTLALALNYGSRTEIVDAVQAVARKVKDGTLMPEDVDEATISAHLYTAGIPDPDLLIRTAGEMRISNYLLWQISYAELHVTETLWPDFGPEDLHAAFRRYAARRRTFGGLGKPAARPG